ncbi:MAG: amidohydrolase family protein, partial [Bacteroidales bacterium]
ALTKEEALRSMTIWGAKATGEDMEKGSIEAGKYADFIITDRDFMIVPEKEIPATKVIGTYLNGQKVY